jgi:hypothetical protein
VGGCFYIKRRFKIKKIKELERDLHRHAKGVVHNSPIASRKEKKKVFLKKK